MWGWGKGDEAVPAADARGAGFARAACHRSAEALSVCLHRRYTFTRKGYEGLRKDVEKCLRNAHLLKVGQACSKGRAQGEGGLHRQPALAAPWSAAGPARLTMLAAHVPSSRLPPAPAAQSMLEKGGVKTMLNELSSTVVFERPREEAFVRKWQLACEGDIAHVVVMPNITIRKLETFVQELVESRWVYVCMWVRVRVRVWCGGGG